MNFKNTIINLKNYINLKFFLTFKIFEQNFQNKSVDINSIHIALHNM